MTQDWRSKIAAFSQDTKDTPAAKLADVTMKKAEGESFEEDARMRRLVAVGLELKDLHEKIKEGTKTAIAVALTTDAEIGEQAIDRLIKRSFERLGSISAKLHSVAIEDASGMVREADSAGDSGAVEDEVVEDEGGADADRDGESPRIQGREVPEDGTS